MVAGWAVLMVTPRQGIAACAAEWCSGVDHCVNEAPSSWTESQV